MSDEIVTTTSGSAAIGELAAALARAQGQMAGAAKDSDNPFFHSTYADLASIWEACRGPLSANGLAVIQLPRGLDTDGYCSVETILCHASGEWRSVVTSMLVPVTRKTEKGEQSVRDNPQGIGSYISYIRRYALAAVTGVYQVDDDAEAATGRGQAVKASRGKASSPATPPAQQAPPKPQTDTSERDELADVILAELSEAHSGDSEAARAHLGRYLVSKGLSLDSFPAPLNAKALATLLGHVRAPVSRFWTEFAQPSGPTPELEGKAEVFTDDRSDAQVILADIEATLASARKRLGDKPVAEAIRAACKLLVVEGDWRAMNAADLTAFKPHLTSEINRRAKPAE